MTNEEENNRFIEEVNILLGQFETSGSPRHRKVVKLAKQAQANREKLEKSISGLQETLDYLRIHIKYLIFDLEATRRENDYLRHLLEELSGDCDSCGDCDCNGV